MKLLSLNMFGVYEHVPEGKKRNVPIQTTKRKKIKFQIKVFNSFWGILSAELSFCFLLGF